MVPAPLESPPWSAFRPDVRGQFLDRPNRFVVRVLVGGAVAEAHCPNPGRITELLFPGSPVLLERAPGPRKLAYTLAAVERPGPGGSVTTVPLISVRANPAVQALVLPRLFPGARAVRPEFPLEGSRFDFLVEDREGLRHLIEVKACSEVEHGTALFPDAPSDRARKHLEELAAWGDRGYRPHVVFAVVHGRPRTFGPNIHTDPAFARTLAALSSRLDLHAAVFETQSDGTTRVADPDLPLDLGPPGPDSGHLLTVGTEEAGRWTVGLRWICSGFEREVSRAPARRSLAVRGPSDRREEFLAELGALRGAEARADTLVWSEDPMGHRGFIDAVMRWRHCPPAAGGI